jgi:drug/metabolite transporter (DMT)-like permease
MPGQKAAILSYVDPLVAVVVSVVILGEQLTLLQAVGGVLILGFTLWNELSTGETTKTKKGVGK